MTVADYIDIANDRAQQRLDDALASRRGAVAEYVAAHIPADCEECGEEIPTARREAAPWASTCIDCQSMIEHKAKGVHQ